MSQQKEELQFTGERFMPGVHGNIEVEHLHRYLQASELCREKIVLDIASGEGYGSAMLARNALQVFGVDISEDAVRHAQAQYAHARLEFRVGSCAAIPLADSSVDLVVSFETIEHHDQHEEMMLEIKRVLRPDGILLISSPDKYHYSDEPGYKNEFHVKELYEQEFKQLLSRHFRNQTYFGQRVLYGSAIFPEASTAPFVSYRNNGDGVEVTQGIARPLYWLGLASDGPLTIPSGGIMELPPDDTDYVRYWVKEVAARDQRIDALDIQVAEGGASRAELDKQLAQQAVFLAELEQASRRQADQQDARIAALSERVSEQSGRLTQCDEKLAEQLRSLADLERLQQQASGLNAQVTALRDHLTQMHRSRSWRLTAPLRGLKAALLKRPGVGQLVRMFARNIGVKRLALTHAMRDVQRSGLFDRQYYLDSNSDVQRIGMDPLRHYLTHGWREHRDPSPKFSTAGYLSTHPDVARADINPLLHFVRFGQVEGRACHPSEEVMSPPIDRIASTPAVELAAAELREVEIPQRRSGPQVDEEIALILQSGLFDEPYYRAMYADLRNSSEDVIRHYCEVGWLELRNPSPSFDTRYYLDTYPDIKNARINPFWHYVLAGEAEQRRSSPPLRTRHEDGEIPSGQTSTDIFLIARYTQPDWAISRAGRPLFEGHLQPLLPRSDWGWYELPNPAVFRMQAEIALRHGIRGFCFDLECSGEAASRSMQLLEAWLRCEEAEIPFCVNLDLRNGQMPDALLALVRRALAARRSIKAATRPLLVVTVPPQEQSANEVLQRLRLGLGTQQLSETFLIARWELLEPEHQLKMGAGIVDALLEGATSARRVSGGYSSALEQRGVAMLPYSVVVAEGVHRSSTGGATDVPVYRTVVLGRDLTLKNAAEPSLYTGFRLAEYRRWLDAVIDEARRKHAEDLRFVFLDAWNDWNEGLFVEPDQQGGYARLNETTRALLGIPLGLRMPKVSVLVPNYNHARFLPRRLDSIYGQTYRNIEVILMDDCSTDNSREVMARYALLHPETTRTLFNEKNAGTAFRQWARGIAAATGELVWIAESDDFCDPNFLEVLVRCFDDEAVMLAHSRCVFVDQDEVPMANYLETYVADLDFPEKWASSHVETAHLEVRHALGIKNTIPNASGVLFRRPVDMALLTDESWRSMVVAGDWVFYLLLLKGGKIAYSVDTANYFRRYVGSAAEVTYRRDVFYREVGIASRTVAEHYDVPLEVLERCRNGYSSYYDRMVGNSSEEFESWYDHAAALEARKRRRPNIMVSTMAFYPGGAEILPIRLANEFKRMGLSVLMFSVGVHPREDRIWRMLRSDIPVVETSSVSGMRDTIAAFGIEALNSHQWHVQKYPCFEPDVFHGLHSHVASLHGMIEHGTAFAVTAEQLHLADDNVSVWVYTADKNLKPFADIGLFDDRSGRFVKLPNGMQPPHIQPESRSALGIPEDAFVLCCVSRAIPDKGWAETIEVVARARALSGRDIRLVLVGNGVVYDELCNTGVPDYVYLVGFHENSVGHYAFADMGIMLTWFRSESFPLTIIDCLFAGKPYIATDVGEIRSTLTTQDGVAGAVIALEDWQVPVEVVAAVVAGFASDRGTYERAVALVPQIANRYHIDKVASDYVRLFMSDIHRPGTGAHAAAGASSMSGIIDPLAH